MSAGSEKLFPAPRAFRRSGDALAEGAQLAHTLSQPVGDGLDLLAFAEGADQHIGQSWRGGHHLRLTGALIWTRRVFVSQRRTGSLVMAWASTRETAAA